MKRNVILKLFVLGISLALSHAANAGYEFPPNAFTGTTDEGIPVGCQFVETDVFGKKQFFKCRFQPGSGPVQMQSYSGSEVFTCPVDAEGNLSECQPTTGSIVRKKLFITTSAVDTGLVACMTDYSIVSQDGLLSCAAHHNPLAGIFGANEDRINVLDCKGSNHFRLLIDRVTSEHVGYGLTSPTLWFIGDYGMITFNDLTRSVEWFSAPLKRSTAGGYTLFATSKDKYNGENRREEINFDSSLERASVGDVVTGYLKSGAPINCQVMAK